MTPPIGAARAGVVSGGDAIPDGLVDNFEEVLYEDQVKTLTDRYSGNTAQYERNQDSPVIEGDYSLKHTGNTQNETMVSDDVPNVPSRGDTFAYLANIPNQTATSIVFGYTSDTETYGLTFSGDNLRLYKDGFSGNDTFASTDPSLSGGAWYDVEVDWGATDITARVYSVDQSTGDRQQEEASITGSDTAYDTGKVGFFCSFRETDVGVYDDFRLIE